MKKFGLIAFFLWYCLAAYAQETFPYNGVYDHRDRWYAFTNATVVSKAGTSLSGATLVVRDGIITALGVGITPPAGAVVIDLAGKYIYPSFIDLYSNYGLPEEPAGGGGGQRNRTEQMLTNKPGAYAWNEALRPEYAAHTFFQGSEKTAKPLREQGFGATLSHRMDGISRGTGTLVTLSDERPHQTILQPSAAHVLSFRKGSSTQSYPGSLMGIIALLRQTYLDGRWYTNQKEEVNLSLAAWNEAQKLPQIFAVDNWQDLLRVARLGEEFGVRYIVKGAGDEYQRIDAIAQTKLPVVLPLKFPAAYEVTDPYDAMLITLDQMRHWELAPANPARVAAAGITFALTAEGLEKPADFLPALRKSIEHGLTEEQALRALTETPARLLGVYDRIGSLETGKTANFIVTSGPVFGKETIIYQNWVAGKPFVIKNMDHPNWLGQYTLTLSDMAYRLSVTGDPAKPDMTLTGADTVKVKVTYTYASGLLSLSFTPSGAKGLIRLSGVIQGQNWAGRGQDEQGRWLDWSASYNGPNEATAEKPAANTPAAPTYVSQMSYPFGAYGWTERPQAGVVLIKNATVWTNEATGKMDNTDVLIRNGKIAAVGKNLSAPDATIVDGTGKHITAGIIDEHSHIAASRGINEGTQASSAEVRIGDIIDATDIDIYRQLAGGVTAVQVLHGSSNPIGGQSAIIKLRWGLLPEEMKWAGAPGFIKFALGENVKQANWGDGGTRYPQTRMGVEQVYENYFTRAREYGEALQAGRPVRRDLELDALWEILQSKRFITCHSYQQGEINMLMKVAERHRFKVNTFTHILEGYKVADIMAQHGAGGSSFSDWWAYKFEVVEAIPHNGAILHEQGVVTAFNSDDAEMARRLNQEAAKAVLFGGVSEEEALKFVTLNPAKLLHLDGQTGSIRTGKDADLVLWSHHPLSIYARAEQTYVDGVKYFDLAQDERMRAALQEERHQLVQKMMQAGEKGERTQPMRGRRGRHYHCDDEEDEGNSSEH